MFKRIFSERNIAKFKTKLAGVNWESDLSNIINAQEAFTALHTVVTKAHNECFPITKIKRGYANRKTWLTIGLKKSINYKNKLYVMSVKNPTERNKKLYSFYKSKLNYLIRKAERDHIEHLFNLYKTNLRRSWQIMKDVLNKS